MTLVPRFANVLPLMTVTLSTVCITVALLPEKFVLPVYCAVMTWTPSVNRPILRRG
jgi:hypothetical protein